MSLRLGGSLVWVGVVNPAVYQGPSDPAACCLGAVREEETQIGKKHPTCSPMFCTPASPHLTTNHAREQGWCPSAMNNRVDATLLSHLAHASSLHDARRISATPTWVTKICPFQLTALLSTTPVSPHSDENFCAKTITAQLPPTKTLFARARCVRAMRYGLFGVMVCHGVVYSIRSSKFQRTGRLCFSSPHPQVPSPSQSRVFRR